MVMKQELKVVVFQKSAEYSCNGGPKQKVALFPPIIDKWIPMVNGNRYTYFKVGNKEFELCITRIKKVKKHA